jgi:hypothetical protein
MQQIVEARLKFSQLLKLTLIDRARQVGMAQVRDEDGPLTFARIGPMHAVGIGFSQGCWTQ